MSKNACRMTGMILMIISIFPIMAGLYFPAAGVETYITSLLLIVGIILLVAGTVFYKILKSE